MTAPTMFILRGLPGSGKSTAARKLHAANGAEIVNRDALRFALHGTYWSGEPAKEEEVTFFEQSLVADNLRHGRSVIVDATNLDAGYLAELRAAGEHFGANVEVITLRTPVERCIANDNARRERGERYVGEEVIRRMAQRYPEFDISEATEKVAV